MIPAHNHILATLPDSDLKRLLPDLELVEMPLGMVLHEPDVLPQHLYFPTTSIVSLAYVMVDGNAAHVAITGKEGLVGFSLLGGNEGARIRAAVERGGHGYRLRADIAEHEFAMDSELPMLALRYTQALLTQMAQTAVCSQHHSLEQQLCRWLLLGLDRLPAAAEPVLPRELMTHMADAPGVDVAGAIDDLQEKKLIRCGAGHIVVLNRPEISRCACECYGVLTEDYDRLLRSGW
jgi:hypothetical protein